jgi:hypothetical protein
VHDGQPIIYSNVLAMALPFLTTKRGDASQKGRFGIGLKTLARISTKMTAHSRPYHFAVEHLKLDRTEAEAAIEQFYDPTVDTLLVLNLTPAFDMSAFRIWFEGWNDEGLLFLNTVQSFRWSDESGATLLKKSISFGDWEPFQFDEKEPGLVAPRCRLVGSETDRWKVYNASVRVPRELKRAHKAKPELAPLSIAISEKGRDAGIFIAFRTRVKTNLPISIDALFDPSTAREELIENSWNGWLIERCADVVGYMARGLLESDPQAAWNMIPLAEEWVGSSTKVWPGSAFAAAFARIREEIGSQGNLLINGDLFPLSEVAYEQPSLIGLLSDADIHLLKPTHEAVSLAVRDQDERWRAFLDSLNVSETVDVQELLEGFSRRLFNKKGLNWWIEAAVRITAHHLGEEVFGVPFLLGGDGRPVACYKKGSASRPLFFGASVSPFASKWNLLDRLHDAYGEGKAGERVRDWLVRQAEYLVSSDPAAELNSFAETYQNNPVELDDDDLRQMRDRFDLLSDRVAEDIGRRVGSAILLDGLEYKSGNKRVRKVIPATAYLPRTLDSEHPDWPETAGKLPGIAWISAGYDEKLKTTASLGRRRSDGSISRGARRFLMLLGVQCAPRLLKKEVAEIDATSNARLLDMGANAVDQDFVSPDLEAVLSAFQRFSKKERRARSPALIRCLSRYWEELYEQNTQVAAHYRTRFRNTFKGDVFADWFYRLREVEWVAIGNGNLARPRSAVIRNPHTEAFYQSSAFIVGLDSFQIHSKMSSVLEFVAGVRVSDLLSKLEDARDENRDIEQSALQSIYRTISKFCPKPMSFSSKVGDLSVTEVRDRFSNGRGLISLAPGQWKKPKELLKGRDIFHEPSRFAPAGASYAELWRLLEIHPPALLDCINHCQLVSQPDYSVDVEASMIEVYRHMDALLGQADRRTKDRLKLLPLRCSDLWVEDRPVYLVEDRELRSELMRVMPKRKFWLPPCDVRNLPNFVAALDLVTLHPSLKVLGELDSASDEGERLRERFQRAVDYLSNELARNDQSARNRIAVPWDALRSMTLFIHRDPFEVSVTESNLTAGSVRVRMKAYLSRTPLSLHVWLNALTMRDSCGRAIASLFPGELQRAIESEWVTSWLESEDRSVEMMRFSSDEESLQEALSDIAAKVDLNASKEIVVTVPGSRSAAAKPRVLKTFQGGICSIKVSIGTQPTAQSTRPSDALLSTPPPPSQPGGGTAPAALGYSNADLEQRGWEILIQALNTNDSGPIVDFRKRHGVGADGVVNWKTFVELKTNGRAMPSYVTMTNAEYERAKERGKDFILALVYGLEEGQETEARLIVDPARNVSVSPVNGIRLVGLSDAPAVILHFS